jgi:HNH endonuclease
MQVCSVDGCKDAYYARGLCGKHYERQRRSGNTDGGSKAHGTLQERFERKVLGGEGCWKWQGNIKPNGYGAIQAGGKGSPTLLAHRVSYALSHGEIPSGMVVMHTCDNRACVNPSHLRLGTFSDNTRDAISKGRFPQCLAGFPKNQPRGSAHPNALINEDIVRSIRASKLPVGKLAAELGLSRYVVSDVRRGKSWSHVK